MESKSVSVEKKQPDEQHQPPPPPPPFVLLSQRWYKSINHYVSCTCVSYYDIESHLLLHHASWTSPDVRSPVPPRAPDSFRRVGYHPEQLRGLVGDVSIPRGHVLAVWVVTEHLCGQRQESKHRSTREKDGTKIEQPRQYI